MIMFELARLLVFLESIRNGKCPVDMVKLDMFCIDKYEYPNEYGMAPLVMQSYEDAELSCFSVDKRICKESEWERACHSNDSRPWSRGFTPERKSCNNGHEWVPWSFNPNGKNDKEVARLLRSSPSGYYPKCQTPEGVFDLDGNVEEWVLAERPGHKWPGTLKGGFWAKPYTKCNGSNDVHEPSFRFYETGFRCCRDLIRGD